ncbi:MAG TPA: O-antigen ligase family protein [Pyrinomonadaceae bacterium]|jgi:O-antigen ligase
MIASRTDTLRPADDTRAGARPWGLWLERATVGCLFLLAACAPHSIAATQAAWLLALLCWVARLVVRPRPKLYRTPVDYALLGFFCLTFLSALCSYDPLVSVGKLRAASLFTIVYVVAENVRRPAVLRALALVLVCSCLVNVAYTLGVFARGRGVKVTALDAAGPLYAAGVRAGETLVAVDGAAANSPEEIERGLRAARTAADQTVRWPDGTIACRWDAASACLSAHRAEVLSVFNVPRASLPAGDTAAARLGIETWARGRDDRAKGFFGHYTTYAEALQLVGALALGLFVALPRKRSTRGALLAATVLALTVALVLTVTRASWLGFLLAAFTIALAHASRRALAFTVIIALPLVLAGLFVLQQQRRVGFIDPREGSTAWRLVVWREGARILVSRPRHLLVGVGMDTLKQHWRAWGMFQGGRLPWGHLHSTPLQIAFERGLPALAAWLALLFTYGHMLWRLARRGAGGDWLRRGLALGALGGLVGFATSGLVHYNLGDSEVVMIFYLIMGLALAAHEQSRQGEASGSV